ncbi:MAG: ABC-F family ATP-binding cassette domain-containing protein, partial [Leptospiraceae bacterium]|nr:ABC-F family ATP-binding cassette domain-containing protein [Leptospiraceae bacterium]
MSAIISAHQIGRSFGARHLFEDATVTINDDQKIGVIGRNGAGKSTFFRMVLGEESPDEGEIIIRKGAIIAHLEQHDAWSVEESILDFMMRHTGAEHWQCARTLARFGFGEDQLEEPIEAFSGGYRMRIKLASMLVREPDFLMLDEPTNYLDLNTQLILEDFLNSFRGGYMVISHDREFIKRTTSATLEVADGGLFLFPGPLEDYFEFVAEERQRKEREARNVEARRKHLQAFVDRFGAKASKATQAQSRVKQLEKLQPIEIKNKISNVRMRVPDVSPSRGLILTMQDLDCGYEGQSILSGIDMKLPAGEKYAIVGENGQGKTTLLKTLSGELQA